jgi:autotransporter-associated beta strand protein
MTVSGPISLGTGGITVQGVANSGNFSIRLSGNNSYSGETRVISGTLMLSGDARINDASTVRIDSGAVLHLDFTGTDTAGALFLGGESMPDGTYGSLTSSATNKSAAFAGNGILQVGGGGGGNYASWAITNGIGGEPFDGDFNNDGISNGVAYALGLSPTASSHPAGVLSGATITFTKGAEAITNADVTWIIETSETLSGSWMEEVTQAAGDTTATISYQLNPAPGTPKKFARLKVVKTP